MLRPLAVAPLATSNPLSIGQKSFPFSDGFIIFAEKKQNRITYEQIFGT
jgi:hypothetical protein